MSGLGVVLTHHPSGAGVEGPGPTHATFTAQGLAHGAPNVCPTPSSSGPSPLVSRCHPIPPIQSICTALRGNQCNQRNQRRIRCDSFTVALALTLRPSIRPARPPTPSAGHPWPWNCAVNLLDNQEPSAHPTRSPNSFARSSPASCQCAKPFKRHRNGHCSVDEHDWPMQLYCQYGHSSPGRIGLMISGGSLELGHRVGSQMMARLSRPRLQPRALQGRRHVSRRERVGLLWMGG